MRDIFYDGRPFRTLKVFDEGNRETLRIEVGTSVSAIRLQLIIGELIEVSGKPAAIRLDNSPEMPAQSFVEWAERQIITLRFTQPGKPNQNASIEWFNKSYRQEVLDANLLNTLDEVQTATDEWVEDCNLFRPHKALGRIPLASYLARLQSNSVPTSNL